MAQSQRDNGRTEDRTARGNTLTLGELRAFVQGCDGMPDEAPVYARAGLGRGHITGSRVLRVSAVDDGTAGRQ